MSPQPQPILEESFLKKYKGIQPEWGFNGLGYIVFKRTYSRPLYKEDGSLDRSETWWETIRRCIEGAQKIGAEYTKTEAEILFDAIFNLKCSFAGRMLWQLGTSTVDRFGANSLINCYFTTITNIEDFCFIFENLMLGGGVGYSVKREHIHELPKIKHDVNITLKDTKDADFIIPDSREGWVELLRKVLTSFFHTGKGFNYSTVLIRGYGEPIRSFGGTASGPKILVEGISNICKVLKSREGKKLRSIDVLDIANLIGSIVVAGNVRRSSQISIGDPDDILFLRAKRWDLGNIPNWRAMSNNSIYADSYNEIMPEVWEGYVGNGEAYGFININLSQNHGRIGEKIKDPCVGPNPCAELLLQSKEACCLSEIFLPNIKSKEELIKLAKLLYKNQKSVCALKYIHAESNEIIHKNFRIGLGITGICQSTEEQLEWLSDAYDEIKKFDIEWSKRKGYPKSIKLTTIKPSGSLSLLAGVTPGVHPAYSKFYIRRVRMSSNDPLVQLCKEHGYNVDPLINLDGTQDRGTMVVEFPCSAGNNATTSNEITAIKQLEIVKRLQSTWADNSISVTVYYKESELEDIKKWMKENYETSIKTVSFLRYQGHNFKQAPYEEITEGKYHELIKGLKPFKKDDLNIGNGEFADSLECSKGACPIK